MLKKIHVEICLYGTVFLTMKEYGECHRPTSILISSTGGRERALIPGFMATRVKFHQFIHMKDGLGLTSLLRVCPGEDQAGGDNAQITDLAQTWHKY